MFDIVIAIENLSKRYWVGHQSRGRSETLRDVMAHSARNFARKAVDTFRGRQIVQGDEVEEFWALKNVNFEVNRGETIGIIGKNGAGKSTLLKILSRITEPTKGRVQLRGRVASLLEVGTGFHPELTGRENIFLNGAILGMTRREIRTRFDEIVAFAEVEKFLDTPVKHYSSGMYVRLAFAVAAHLDPEILVVDEVLAVGDNEFQKKCLGKMRDVSVQGGRTVLFVSHNLGAIGQLCSRSVWLARGEVAMVSRTSEVINGYLTHGQHRPAERWWPTTAGPVADIALRAVRVCQPAGVANSVLDMAQPFEIEITTEASRPTDDVAVSIQILNANGQTVVHSADITSPKIGRRHIGTRTIACRIPGHALNVGTYYLAIAASIPNVRMLFSEEDTISWTVEAISVQTARFPADAWRGILSPELPQWSTPVDGSTK
jgi:lipopolysaccharide transport system ATP-binding protein